MLRILPHIERLLLIHDCVIVPKLGGFVLQTIPASVHEDNTFSPSFKEMTFNMTLQHNDGLLAEAYMKQYDVNFKKAELMIEEDVSEMKASLQQYRKLSLGVLGSFVLGEEGQMIYKSPVDNNFNIATYGFSSFTMLPLSVLEESDPTSDHSKKTKKDTLYIPVSRRLLRVVAASAAAIALFLLISTPVKDVNLSAYKASFIPTEITFPVQTKAEAIVAESVAVENEKPADEPSVIEKAEPARPVERVKMYHIVVASFPTEKQADDFISAADKKDCKNMNKILRDGKYRIYADRFENRGDAEKYMTTLRTNPKYKEAWLFASR